MSNTAHRDSASKTNTTGSAGSSAGDATVLGLDVGSVRVGVAVARLDVRIPRPLVTLNFSQDICQEIAVLAHEQGAVAVVVGWPRGLQGQTTEQTRLTEEFVAGLRKELNGVPVYLQDEALTSQQAESELRSRKKPYDRAEVDALAAVYILEDYLASADLVHAMHRIGVGR